MMNIPFVPGMHLLLDFYGASHLDDLAYIEQALANAAAACNATVLGIHLHSFGDKAGVTGVAMLAESHISIHTWPEINFMALDVFLCGNADPHLAVPVLRDYFKPGEMRIIESVRGKIPQTEIIR